jgi:hypothetical protein
MLELFATLVEIYEERYSLAPQDLNGDRKKQCAIGTYNSIVSGSRDEFQNERMSTVLVS